MIQIIGNTHACLLAEHGRAVDTHWYAYICTCMYVYVCIFLGDVALFETLGTKTQHGCPGGDLWLSSCLNTSEFPLLGLIN